MISLLSLLTAFTDRKNLAITLLGAAVFLLILLQLHTCSKKAFDCNSCTETVKVVHDTIWPVDTPHIVYVGQPVPAKVWPVKRKQVKADTIYLPGSVTVIREHCPELPATACDSARYYAYNDTVEQVHLIIRDSVNGAITWRKIEVANLKPEVTTTITKVLKEKPKFYIGGSFTIPGSNLKAWGIGPSALFTIPKVGGFSYYYDIKNNAHTGGIYALIRFKRKKAH